MDILIENRVAGIVATLTWDIIERGFIEAITLENIPIVGLAGARVVEGIDTVTIDDVMVGRIAVSHLIERGHRKIGFIGIRDSKTTEKRLRGYLDALREAGIEVLDDYVQLGVSFSRQDGYELAGELVRRCPEVTAVFVIRDVMAAGAIDRFNDLGISVPGQMAIVACDNSIAQIPGQSLLLLILPRRRWWRTRWTCCSGASEKRSSPLST